MRFSEFSLRQYLTDFTVLTGQEFIVADLSYIQFGDSHYWCSVVDCTLNSVGWSIGYNFYPEGDFLRSGGIKLFSGTKLTVDFGIPPRGNGRILWGIDNTGLVEAYTTSGNWKKEEYLGHSTVEAQDWSSLVGQPIRIYNLQYRVDFWFYGLRIYDNSTTRNLLAEYLPFDVSSGYGKLLNTVNGQVITYSIFNS